MLVLIAYIPVDICPLNIQSQHLLHPSSSSTSFLVSAAIKNKRLKSPNPTQPRQKLETLEESPRAMEASRTQQSGVHQSRKWPQCFHNMCKVNAMFSNTSQRIATDLHSNIITHNWRELSSWKKFERSLWVWRANDFFFPPPVNVTVSCQGAALQSTLEGVINKSEIKQRCREVCLRSIASY